MRSLPWFQSKMKWFLQLECLLVTSILRLSRQSDKLHLLDLQIIIKIILCLVVMNFYIVPHSWHTCFYDLTAFIITRIIKMTEIPFIFFRFSQIIVNKLTKKLCFIPGLAKMSTDTLHAAFFAVEHAVCTREQIFTILNCSQILRVEITTQLLSVLITQRFTRIKTATHFQFLFLTFQSYQKYFFRQNFFIKSHFT